MGDAGRDQHVRTPLKFFLSIIFSLQIKPHANAGHVTIECALFAASIQRPASWTALYANRLRHVTARNSKQNLSCFMLLTCMLDTAVATTLLRGSACTRSGTSFPVQRPLLPAASRRCCGPTFCSSDPRATLKRVNLPQTSQTSQQESRVGLVALQVACLAVEVACSPLLVASPLPVMG